MILESDSVCVCAQAVLKNQEGVRAVQRKARAVVVKPTQPHEVIVISPDTNEVAKAKHDAAASKKNVTYSYVLTARSKVSFFITCNGSYIVYLLLLVEIVRLLPRLLILILRTKTTTSLLWSMLRTCTLSTKKLRYPLWSDPLWIMLCECFLKFVVSFSVAEREQASDVYADTD